MQIFKNLLCRFATLAMLVSFAVAVLSGEALGQSPGPRLALVIGNAAYRAGSLATSANDAGLVAGTLRSAGFDVTGAANLNQDALRGAFRDFLGKIEEAGPDAVVFVYLAGRALQYAGENYFVPVDATIIRDTDVPIEAYRLSDFTRALAAVQIKARIIVLDAARQNSFVRQGNPLASGLALVEAEPETLYAFNASPGTIAPDEPGPYGAYAEALVEMLREGGISINEVFARTRLRVNEITDGAVVPWDVSKLASRLILFARPASAPPLDQQVYVTLQTRPIGEFPEDEAYAAALDRDTYTGYQVFLDAYPDVPFAARIRALLAVRREALTWARTAEANTPNAYWTYVQRYPSGPHFYDARRRLMIISAPLEPPPRYDPYAYPGLLPPPPIEHNIIDRPFIVFNRYNYPPPRSPPVRFLPQRPREYGELPPPPPPQESGYLPVPHPRPLPYGQPPTRAGNLVQPNYGGQRPAGFPPAGPPLQNISPSMQRQQPVQAVAPQPPPPHQPVPR